MRIAILDDDRTSLQLVEQALTGSDSDWAKTIQCTYFTSGQALLDALRVETFEALVLDRQLPDVSGDEILAWVRVHLPPQLVVVMVTGLAGVSESASMLMSGADDYVSKPFSGAELLARIQRLLERSTQSRAVAHGVVADAHVSLLGFDFDRSTLSVRWGDEVSVLSEREFALALLLCRNVGRPLSRDEIYESVWRRRAVSSSRAVDTLVHRMRAKLSLDERRGFVVQAMYGFGYRLDILNDTL